jgi:hypothetical protein
MSDAVAAATQLHPASPRDGADRFIRTGTDGVLALGHYLGRGLEAAFAHVIHVRDERIASLEWVTGTPSWPDPVPPATG